MARKKLRIRHCFICMVSVFAIMAPVPVQSVMAFPVFGQDIDVVIPVGQRFIDELGVQVPLPSEQAMALRFRDGRRYGPNDLVTINDPRIAPYHAHADQILAKLLLAYTKGPKPSAVPFRIVESSDMNCMAVTVDDPPPSKLGSSSQPPSVHTTIPRSVEIKPNAANNNATSQSSSASSPEPPPSKLEIRCTTAFLEHVDDYELEFTLAHEMSHILLGHWEREDALLRQQKTITSLVADGVLLSAVLNSKYSRVGNQINMVPTPAVSKNTSKLLVADLILQEYATVLQGPHWVINQERQADIMGLDLLHEAGYTRVGAVSLMTKMAKLDAEEAKTRPSFIQSFLTSTALMAFVDFNQTGAKNKNTVTEIETQAAAMLYTKWHNDSITHVHDNADKRSKTMAKYEDDHKEATDVVSPDAKNFFESFKDAMAPIHADEKLEREMSTTDCDSLSPTSLATVETLRHSKHRTQQENYDLANFEICKSHWVAALPLARSAAEGETKSPAYFIQYITVLQRTHDFKTSLHEIDEATLQAPPEQQYVIMKIQSLKALRRDSEAEALAKACRDNERANVGAQCMAAVDEDIAGHPLPASPADDISSQSGATSKPASNSPPSGLGATLPGIIGTIFKPLDTSSKSSSSSSASDSN